MTDFIRKLFRWRKVPPPPLTADELLKLELAFQDCSEDCPFAIILRAYQGHIKWQEYHLKNAKENYDK
jgi:hypothetical protein